MQRARCWSTLGCLLAAALTMSCGGAYSTGGSSTQSGQPPAPPSDPRAQATDLAVDPDRISFRFSMTQPANEDFAIKDDDVFVYVRPFRDYLSFKVQGREQNFVRIQWEDSEFIDLLGRRYKIVPPEVELSEAATIGIPYKELAAGELYVARLTLLDPNDRKTISELGGKPFPIVPPDAGSPSQLRGQQFFMTLALEINSVPRQVDMTFEIRDARVE